MQNANPGAPSRTIYFPIVLRYGLMAAVTLSLINFAMYATGWMLTQQFVLWGVVKMVNGVLLVIFYFLFARAVRKAEGGHVDFLTLFVHCLFLAFAIGLAGSVYDLIFYHYIDPGYDGKIMDLGRQFVAENYQRQGLTEAQRDDMLKSLDENAKMMAETHGSAYRTVLSAVSSELLPGGMLGAIMGVVMRRR